MTRSKPSNEITELSSFPRQWRDFVSRGQPFIARGAAKAGLTLKTVEALGEASEVKGLRKPNAWLGSARAHTPLHQDHMHNLVVQLGAKHLRDPLTYIDTSRVMLQERGLLTEQISKLLTQIHAEATAASTALSDKQAPRPSLTTAALNLAMRKHFTAHGLAPADAWFTTTRSG